MVISRRRYLRLGSTIGVLAIAGCSDSNDSGGDGGSNGGDVNRTPERERVCTKAYISDFNWDGVWFSEDDFEATLVNEGEVAGTVIVELKFWESERKNSLQGTVERRVSIGAQDTEDIAISANPPTDNTDWASMDVSEQDCQYR